MYEISKDPTKIFYILYLRGRQVKFNCSLILSMFKNYFRYDAKAVFEKFNHLVYYDCI